MRHPKRIIHCFLTVVFLFGNHGVGVAQTLTPIHIGVSTNSATWFPLYVAWKKGLFREQGLELLPVYMQARTSLAALASKQIGYITQTGSSLTAIARGLPARLVMVFTDKTHHVLVVKPEITSPAQLRGRVVAISQPGGTVHRELLMILDKFKIDSKEVRTASLGDARTSLAGLKAGNVDAAMLMTPLELYLEKDGFKPLVYLKDILEFPLLGIIVNNDVLRDKPDQVKKVLAGALKGIAFTKSHRDEVVPLLKEFIGLENLEMAQRAYDSLRDIWPDSGLPTEKGLKNVMSVAEVPAGVAMEKIVDWSFVKEVSASLKTK
ncbi:MAG TPA: ABC transporter substrate-binding protein [Verrucomicrobiae bacterium]|nr:ABC transporter substrate-binding protein [Verrucomicrobiae bacterium]